MRKPGNDVYPQIAFTLAKGGWGQIRSNRLARFIGRFLERLAAKTWSRTTSLLVHLIHNAGMLPTSCSFGHLPAIANKFLNLLHSAVRVDVEHRITSAVWFSDEAAFL